MASVNKVILVANLGRDPEIRYSPEGTAVCHISVATTSQWKDKATGEKREETEWHRVVFYNRLAEIAAEFLKKGRAVYIEGRLKTRKWQDKTTGQDRYATEIIGNQMQMLGSGAPTNEYNQDLPYQAPRAARPAPAAAPAPQGGTLADMGDDIPFD